MSESQPEILRVLIAEDRIQVRQDLHMALPLAGEACSLQIQVVGEAADGLETIQKAASLQPDVVLLDLEMPVMDGYSAARQIKQQHPHMRVVALSIHSDPSSREKAEVAGCDAFVEKGAPVAEIIHSMQGVLK